LPLLLTLLPCAAVRVKSGKMAHAGAGDLQSRKARAKNCGRAVRHIVAASVRVCLCPQAPLVHAPGVPVAVAAAAASGPGVPVALAASTRTLLLARARHPSGSNFCRIDRDVSCVHTPSIIAVLEDHVCFALTKQDKIRDTILYCDIEHVEELDGEDALGGGGPSRAFTQSFSKKKSARREAVTMRHEHERSREGTSFRIFDATHHRNYFFRCVRLEPWKTTGSRCLLSPSMTTGWKVRTSERPLSKRFAPQWMNAGGRRCWPRISTLLNERALGALR